VETILALIPGYQEGPRISSVVEGARVLLPVVVTAPLTAKAELALFSMTCVTFAPTAALTNAEPLPVPEFVTVPVLFRLVVDTVMPLAVVLLLFNTTLPTPVTPPDTVSSAVLLLVRVRFPAPTVTAPLTVRAELALFSVIPVTLLPTAALITLVAVIPELVIVPVLFTAVVESVADLQSAVAARLKWLKTQKISSSS